MKLTKKHMIKVFCLFLYFFFFGSIVFFVFSLLLFPIISEFFIAILLGGPERKVYLISYFVFTFSFSLVILFCRVYYGYGTLGRSL